MKTNPDEIKEILDQIEENHIAYAKTRSTRKKYQLCVANESLFAQIGVSYPPMIMQKPPRGIGQRIVWWWLNRGPNTDKECR